MKSDTVIRFLYAEDDALTRLFVSKILDKLGTVSPAKNGLEAFELFQKEKFDILVTDLSMPGMDGFQLIQQVRNINSDIPIVVTTAYRDEYRKLKDMDGVRVVDKPINTKSLTFEIDKLLNAS